MNIADGKGRTVVGLVTSDKMEKSLVVMVERRVKHSIGKYVRRSTKLHVHDESNSAKVGDVVLVKECRPLSKTKSWVLVDIVERGVSALPEAEKAI